MWRWSFVLLALMSVAGLGACQGQSQPKPLTPDEERQLLQQIEQTHQEERAHFSQEGTLPTQQ